MNHIATAVSIPEVKENKNVYGSKLVFWSLFNNQSENGLSLWGDIIVFETAVVSHARRSKTKS